MPIKIIIYNDMQTNGNGYICNIFLKNKTILYNIYDTKD